MNSSEGCGCQICGWPAPSWWRSESPGVVKWRAPTVAGLSMSDLKTKHSELVKRGFVNISFGFHSLLEMANVPHETYPAHSGRLGCDLAHQMQMQVWCDPVSAWLCQCGDVMPFGTRLFALQEQVRSDTFADACHSVSMLDPNNKRALVDFITAKMNEKG